MPADRISKKQPKIRIESDLALLRRNKLLVGILLIQVLACFFVSQLQQTDDRPELLWLLSRRVVWAILFAQMINLGFFVAMFPATIAFRMSIATGWTIAAISLLVLGDNVGRRPGILNELFQAHLSSLPLVLVGWATPFFLARGFMGWQLKSEFNDAPPPNFSIVSLLFATAMAAAAMKFLTLGEKPFLITGIAMALIGTGIGFSMIIPITKLIMNSVRPRRTLMKLAIFIGFLTVSVSSIIRWIDPNFSNDGLAFILTVVLFYGAFLVAIQRLGFKLAVGKPNSE